MFNNLLASLNDFLYSYILIFLLVAAGIYFSIRTKFVQFRLISDAIKALKEKAENNDNGKSVSSFQALTISTASRVGTGNIAGIATAIVAGGPGAVFWMWVMAIVGGASAFVESTLAQVYKVKDGKEFRGGPSYYIERALGKRWLGVLFSILLIACFAYGFNGLQTYNMSSALEYYIPNYSDTILPAVVGLLIAAATAFVIFGGVHRIGFISSVIVPIMAGIYILMGIFITLTNLNRVPEMFSLIFDGAFDFRAIFGGFAGSTVLIGIKRGLFSNEAGMGSTPHAHALAKVEKPQDQGIVAMICVFIDTFVVLTITALVMITSGALNVTDMSANPAAENMAQVAFSTVFRGFGDIFVAICLLFFAFSTIIGWYFFGRQNVKYLFGTKAVKVYSVIAVVCVALGSVLDAPLVWNLSDLFNALMVFPNLIALLALSGLVAKVSREDHELRK